ncbi:MAG: DUF2339 domain-containing protein [Candidatus Hydrogenedentes bacterium]|nr:DUF2339 domain-containing protein [Candidatus Hydrogenedentota bacterium]
MDNEKRIEDLEKEVHELKELVRHLAHLSDATPGAAAASASTHRRLLDPSLVKDVRHRVDKALGGLDEESIETRIGAVWLSRLAIVVMMTSIALAANVTYTTEAIGPWQKIAIGYGVAAAFVLYGILFRKSQDMFSEVLLGGGLATGYFATYAAFFVDRIRVIDAPWLAVPVLLLCLVAIAATAHWRRSQTVAGVSLFLTYYTIVVSSTGALRQEELIYALATSTFLAAVVLVFHALHRWVLLSWVVLIATYLTFLLFFLDTPDGLEMSERNYFWLSSGYLTVCYIVFSLICLIDARKTGDYRHGVAPMAGFNSFIFVALMWMAIRRHYPAEEWMFRASYTGILLALAAIAAWTGPRRNYLFQVFIAKSVIMATLTLEAYYSGEKLLVAMAVECIALAIGYRRSGLTIFKVMGLGLFFITFFAMIGSVKMPGVVHLGPVALPANWFSAVGMAAAFAVVSWFYEIFIRPVRPETRAPKGPGLFSKSSLNVSDGAMAMLHAAGAALVLLVITTLERSEDVALPFLLTGEGALLVLAGLLLRAPQVQAVSVLLFAAAHVIWYLFLWLPRPGFEMQQFYPLYTMLLAILTYTGAWFWDRFLERYRDLNEFEHDATASLPYLAATLLLVALTTRIYAPLHVPAVQAALGLLLLLCALAANQVGLKTSALLALGAGALNFAWNIAHPTAPVTNQPDFLAFFSLFLGLLVIAERITVLIARRELHPRRFGDHARTAMIAVAGALGAYGLYRWSDDSHFIFYLLTLAVIAISLGAVFREGRYRWGALLLFAVIVVYSFSYLDRFSPVYRVLIFGASGVVLLVVSWGYGHFRQRTHHRQPAARTVRSDTDGPA